MKKIRIGTRGSRLAIKQAELVQEAVRQADDRIETELVILHTKGDKILDRALSEIGDKGLFVSEFEQALLEEQIDVAVHSAKDLPMRLAQGLRIVSVLPRADVRDVLAVKKGGVLPELFSGGAKAADIYEEAVIGEPHAAEPERGAGAKRPFVLGTGSRRRQVQAQSLWENAACELIRGNVETRLKKLEEGRYDGILLAKAGLDRLNLNGRTEQRFDFYALCPKAFLPAACQGIIAVEAKENCAYGDVLARICDEKTYLDFSVEQETLAQLGADCSEAAAAWCRQQDGSLLLDVMYGEKRAFLRGRANPEAGALLAKKAAGMVKPHAAG